MDFLLFAVVVALLLILAFYFGNRCPKCKRRHALERTVATKPGGWFRSKQQQWRCKYCGFQEWKEESDSVDYD